MTWGKISRWEPQVRSLLRIVTALTFSLHGWQKFFGLFGGPKQDPSSLLGAAGIIETIGGALLFLGLGTRPVAFILSGEMAIGYLRSHAPRGFWPIQNRGELAVVYCFLWLYFFFAGGGPWSLDRLFFAKRDSRAD